jgi:muconate cycloisomerase
MQRIETHLERAGGGIAARAGLDLALHDWLGKRCGMPLYRLLGADLRAIAPTSVTIGIQAPERACLRAGELIREGARVLKIKLGGGEGLRADRAMFDAVRSAAPPDVRLRVDANGGWTLRDAREMIPWLADRGVEYVEQPLPRGSEGDMPALHKEATIPLFADESCRVASDIPALADRVHGVNLKLMKAGGIREGLRLIHTARAHGLMVMLGCMSESSLAIAASVHLSPLADYLDLDSHLNLVSDPCCGLRWESGCVTPSNRPGLGVSPLGR